MRSPSESVILTSQTCSFRPLLTICANAVTVSPSDTALTCSPLTLIPTHILPGQRADEPTPARFSASAREAPPLKNPNGWRFLSFTSIVAMHMSSSGVLMNFIPKAVDKLGCFSIISFIASTFIFYMITSIVVIYICAFHDFLLSQVCLLSSSLVYI